MPSAPLVADGAKVGVFQVADAPTNWYVYTLPKFWWDQKSKNAKKRDLRPKRSKPLL